MRKHETVREGRQSHTTCPIPFNPFHVTFSWGYYWNLRNEVKPSWALTFTLPLSWWARDSEHVSQDNIMSLIIYICCVPLFVYDKCFSDLWSMIFVLFSQCFTKWHYAPILPMFNKRKINDKIVLKMWPQEYRSCLISTLSY